MEYPIEDCDEVARAQRAREIREGVDPPPGHQSVCVDPVYVAAELSLDNRLPNLDCSLDENEITNPLKTAASNTIMSDSQIVNSSLLNTADAFPNILFTVVDPLPRIIHSQVYCTNT